MIEKGPATEHEMVLAFLRAEIDSSRFGPIYREALRKARVNRTVFVDRADPANPAFNLLRKELLKAVRGYAAGRGLFRGFPTDVAWRRAGLEASEHGRIVYGRHEAWVRLTHGSRLVTDGAANIDHPGFDENTRSSAKAVAEALARGALLPELVVVEGDGGRLILVEGHVRATAYVLSGHPAPIPMLVGTSPSMAGWDCY